MIGQHDDRAFYHRRRWERSEHSETTSASRIEYPNRCDWRCSHDREGCIRRVRNNSVGRCHVEIFVRPSRYKGCHQAHNAQVVTCAFFTTRNSLKLHGRLGSCHIAKVVLTIRHDSRQIPLAARRHLHGAGIRKPSQKAKFRVGQRMSAFAKKPTSHRRWLAPCRGDEVISVSGALMRLRAAACHSMHDETDAHQRASPACCVTQSTSPRRVTSVTVAAHTSMLASSRPNGQPRLVLRIRVPGMPAALRTSLTYRVTDLWVTTA